VSLGQQSERRRTPSQAGQPPPARRQALIRDELRAEFGPGPVAKVPLAAIGRLVRLTAALKEELRLWPPIGIVSRLNCRPDLVVAGARIPRGAPLDLAVRAAHRDPAD
jgi:cytochrome P450